MKNLKLGEYELGQKITDKRLLNTMQIKSNLKKGKIDNSWRTISAGEVSFPFAVASIKLWLTNDDRICKISYEFWHSLISQNNFLFLIEMYMEKYPSLINNKELTYYEQIGFTNKINNNQSILFKQDQIVCIDNYEYQTNYLTEFNKLKAEYENIKFEKLKNAVMHVI